MKLVIALALTIACCLAQAPTTCPGPKQWVARRLTADRSKDYEELAKHSYDEINLRTHSIEEVYQGKERDFFEVLHLYNLNKEYRLNLRTRKCNVTDLNRPWRPVGVPTGSKFLFTAVLGPASIPDEHIPIEVWEGTFPDGIKYLMTIASPDCVPINREFYSNSTGYISERFFDLSLGIKDPSVFIPPVECA